MSTWQIVLWVIVIVLAAILVALFFIGRRLEKKQAEQQAAFEALKGLGIVETENQSEKDNGGSLDVSEKH